MHVTHARGTRGACNVSVVVVRIGSGAACMHPGQLTQPKSLRVRMDTLHNSDACAM